MIRLETLGTISLRGNEGQEVRSVLTQPKRLALLCYLAVESSRGFVRRDLLFGLFWPEFSQSKARQALRQSLYFLRSALGEPIFASRGVEEIGIVPEACICDAWTFSDLLDRGSPEEALAHYRGDFLAGFFIGDSSSAFDQWLYATRERFLQQALEAAWRLADDAEKQGASRDAVRWVRHATRLDPDDERSLQRLLSLLDRLGDRASAMRAYSEFAQRLAMEFGTGPSAETRAIVEAVRARSTVGIAPAESPIADRETDVRKGAAGEADAGEADAGEVDAREIEPMASIDASPGPGSLATSRVTALGARRGRRARISAFASPALVAVLAVAALAMWRSRRHDPPPVIAVGWVQDASGADTAATVRTFAELLATDLARVPGLRVVSHARLYDVLGQLGTGPETPSAISDAARRAGAGELLEAVLSRQPDRTLSLELRRVDLASGAADRGYTIAAGSVFELADRATSRIASDFALQSPSGPLTRVTTTSLAAQRLYEAGLRSFYQGDIQSAGKLFHTALDEDSTFAMAAYYAGLTEQETDGPQALRDLSLALRLAGQVSERERLTIRQAWAFLTDDPAQLAFADSLLTRYPDEPGGALAVGRALLFRGDFLGAQPYLRRAISMDSLSLRGLSPWCRACDALDLSMTAYIAADSLPAAHRIAEQWTRLQPRAPQAWWALESIFDREERYDSARVAEETAERLSPTGRASILPRVVSAIRAGEFANADHWLADAAQNGNVTERGTALWWLVISLRDQGRLREAMVAARHLMSNSVAQQHAFGNPHSLDAVAIAQVNFEMGNFRRSAALFDSLSASDLQYPADLREYAPGLFARHRIWMKTQVATSLAEAGDTTVLTALADSIATWKKADALSRDWVLEYYVRGLLLRSRGQPRAAELEFRRALVSPIEGYSRVNFELARVLLEERRPKDAIPLLRAPLHGWMEGSNYYLPYTDLHALLGRAFDDAGERDSALVHYHHALSAWQHADPNFRPLIDSIERRVTALSARP